MDKGVVKGLASVKTGLSKATSLNLTEYGPLERSQQRRAKEWNYQEDPVESGMIDHHFHPRYTGYVEEQQNFEYQHFLALYQLNSFQLQLSGKPN